MAMSYKLHLFKPLNIYVAYMENAALSVDF